MSASRPIPIPVPMFVAGNGIIGGMEKYVLSLVRGLRSRGCEPMVVAPFNGDFTVALLSDGFPPADLYVMEMGERLSLSSLAALRFHIDTRGVDIVHSHLLPGDILGAAAANLAGIPAVSTLHGIVRCPEERLLHDLYDLRFIAVSEAGRQSAIANGIPEASLDLILNGIDTDHFNPERVNRKASRRALDIPEDAVVAISVTRLSLEKNPSEIIDLAEGLATMVPELIWLIAGVGPLGPSIRHRLGKSPARERVRLLGLCTNVPEILAAADIAVLTSSSESLPLFALEAMSMGLPLVSYDVGGVREALRDGEEGYLIRPSDRAAFMDSMLELTRAAPLRLELGRSARARAVDHFSADRVMEQVLEVYRNAAEGLASNLAPRRTVPADLPIRPEPAWPPVIDMHLHMSGGETQDAVIQTLDEAGVEYACLIPPIISTEDWTLLTGIALLRANDCVFELVAGRSDRLGGFISIDPRLEHSARWLVENARVPGVVGLKLIPNGWRPNGPEIRPIYEMCEEFGLPILFHSGVFIGGRQSNDCRPAMYEAVREFPGLRVVLAHLGWPWVDEAIGVAYMDLLKGRDPQIFLDTSPGTPPSYRSASMARAFAVLGCRPLVFGSDRFLPVSGIEIRTQLQADVALLRSFGASEEDVAAFANGNAAHLFSARTAAPSQTRTVNV